MYRDDPDRSERQGSPEHRNCNRAVAPVVGFVILAGILLLLVTLWQVQIVPDQNSNTEFEHQQAVTNDLVDLRNAVADAPREGSTQRADVELGTEYTDRTIYVNPPPPQGRLTTINERDGEQLQFSIDNANATDQQAGGQVWDGSERTFPTALLGYEIRYNELQTSPTFVSEHSVLYGDFDGQRVNQTGQQIVEDEQISIVSLGGDLDETGIDDANVAAESQAAGFRTVDVEAEDEDEPIELTLPTYRTEFTDNGTAESEWRGLLDTELQQNVQDVTVQNDNVTIELDPDETYELGLGSVEVSNPSAVGAGDPYYVAVTDVDRQVGVGATGELTVEVRDQFDNALSGEAVTIDPDPLTETPTETRRDGTATIEFAFSDIGEQTFEVGHEDALNASADVEVVEAAGGTTRVRWNRTEVVLDEETIDEIEIDNPLSDELLFIELNATSNLGDVPVTFGTENQSAIANNAADLVPDDGEEEFEDDDMFQDGTATAVYAVDRDKLDEDGKFVYVSGGGDGDRMTVREPEPTVDIDIDSTNEPIDEGEGLNVTVDIESTEDVTDEPIRLLDFDDEEVDREEFSLDSGESTSVELGWTTELGDAGNNDSVTDDITVSDADNRATDTTEVTINPVTSVSVTEIRPVTGDPGGEIDPEVDIVNEGSATAEIEVEYELEEETRTESLSVPTGTETVEFDSVPLPDEEGTFLQNVTLIEDGNIVDEEQAEIELQQEFGTLTGTITDGTGSPIANEEITISGDGIDRTVTTGGSGEYTIDELPVGEYDLVADADGFEPSAEQLVEIEADTETEQDFELPDFTVWAADGFTGILFGSIDSEISIEGVSEDITVFIDWNLFLGGYQEQEVTINGETFELEDDARDVLDDPDDGDEYVDLLAPETYTDADEDVLNEIREQITGSTTVTVEDDNDDPVDAEVAEEAPVVD